MRVDRLYRSLRLGMVYMEMQYIHSGSYIRFASYIRQAELAGLEQVFYNMLVRQSQITPDQRLCLSACWSRHLKTTTRHLLLCGRSVWMLRT